MRGENPLKDKLAVLLQEHVRETRSFADKITAAINNLPEREDADRFGFDGETTPSSRVHSMPLSMYPSRVSSSNQAFSERYPSEAFDIPQPIRIDSTPSIPGLVMQDDTPVRTESRPSFPGVVMQDDAESESSDNGVSKDKVQHPFVGSQSRGRKSMILRTVSHSITNDQIHKEWARSDTRTDGWKHAEDVIFHRIQELSDLMEMSVKKHQACVECFIQIMIVLNAMFVGWRVQDQAVNGKASPIGVVGECYFCIVFTLDVLCRLAILDGCKRFFTGDEKAWNVFDTIVVLAMVLDVIFGFAFDVSSSPPSSTSVIRIVRLVKSMRLLHVVRVVRLVKSMREFRLIVFTIARALRGCVASMTVIVLILYCTGIFFTEGSFEHCRKEENKGDALCRIFGSLGISMRSLYESMLHGVLWGDVLDALEPLNAFYSAVFLGFVTFSIIIVLNVVANIFRELAQEIAEKDKEKTCMDDALKERESSMMRLNRLFQELDVNRSGDISKDQFSEGLKKTDLLGLFATMKLDISDVRSVFDLLDKDGNGVIDKHEFVMGCMRLRGDARNADIQKLKDDVDKIRHSVEDVEKMLVHRRGLEESRHFGSKAKDSKDIGKAQVANDNKVVKSKDSKAMNKTSNRERVKKPATNGAQGRIDAAEDRAMLLREIRGVKRKIQSECAIETWQDMRSGLPLEPDEVNLYHFNYHYILPNSSLESITVTGLDLEKAILEKGAKVLLNRAGSTDVLPLAEGCVEEILGPGILRIATHRGRFRHEEDCYIDVGGQSVETKFVSFEKSKSCSYKELVARNPCRAIWYCCHWWGEKVFDFVECVEHHARSRALLDDSSYWVCAYANRQHELDLEIGVHLEATSFFMAMKKVQGVLLILDSDATPFRRIWCDFEIYSSISDANILLDMITIDESGAAQLITEGLLPSETSYQKAYREQNFPPEILSQGIQLQLQDGSSTVPDDKERILQSMAGTSPSDSNYSHALALAVQRANSALHAVFAVAAWPMALKCGTVQDFDAEREGLVRLPDVLKRDKIRQQLKLNLSHMSQLYDHDITHVAEGLTENLRELNLSFEESPNITDEGLIELARHLPRQLEVLRLDFSSCKEISDRGMIELGESLPQTLKTVTLDFANCPLVTAASITELAKHVPDSLSKFKGSFTGTGVDTDFDTPDKIRKFGRKTMFDMIGKQFQPKLKILK